VSTKYLVLTLLGLSLSLALIFVSLRSRPSPPTISSSPPPIVMSSPTPSHSLDYPSPSPQPSADPPWADTPPEGSERFTSEELGITFLFTTEFEADPPLTTKEIGNRVYVYPSDYTPETGQYVEIFDKNPSESLIDAINRVILSGYSTDDCLTIPANHSSTYQTAVISLPSANSGNFETLSEEASRCPQPYAAYGGLAYFLADPTHPNHFVFFSIGQYAIMGDSTRTWQDTLQFTD
jgi:hypothetical protein